MNLLCSTHPEHLRVFGLHRKCPDVLGRLQSFDAAGHRVKKDSFEIGLDKSETILYIWIVGLI